MAICRRDTARLDCVCDVTRASRKDLVQLYMTARKLHPQRRRGTPAVGRGRGRVRIVTRFARPRNPAEGAPESRDSPTAPSPALAFRIAGAPSQGRKGRLWARPDRSLDQGTARLLSRPCRCRKLQSFASASRVGGYFVLVGSSIGKLSLIRIDGVPPRMRR